MGTWGAGNFQNDGALDYVGSLTDSLAGEVDRILTTGTLADADELGERRLVPAVAILEVLAAHVGAAPPRPVRIACWRLAYLAVFDRSMPALDRTGTFTAERRAVVVSTFAALEVRARAFWREPDPLWTTPEGTLVLCPYCATPLDEVREAQRIAAFRAGTRADVPCTKCARNVAADAPLERTPAEYVAGIDAERCKHCHERMHRDAFVCLECGREAEETTE